MIYRLMIKKDNGMFSAVEGINKATGKPIFTTNVINGICFWNQTSDSIKGIEKNIKAKYPNLEFELRKTN